MVPCEFAMKLQGTLSHSLGVVHINKYKIIKLSDYKVQIEGTFSWINMSKSVTHEKILDWENKTEEEKLT